MNGLACLTIWMSYLTWLGANVSAGAPQRTTLTNPKLPYESLSVHAVELRRGPVRVLVVDNVAFGPDHRAGYNGLACLTHDRRKQSIFVPAYAGLNFELIFDGTKVPRARMMEPRRAPMRLRRIDPHTVELYQAPTPTWHLESCSRFAMLPDGVIEMTFECIPHKDVFRQGYIGLFWASYIDGPKSKAIHFLGVPRDAPADARPRWIEAITPKHGTESTHVGLHDERAFAPAPDFPMHYMAFSDSTYRYAEPFYYGVSRGMALAFVFRKADKIRFTQSPSGGGHGNPAWDFEFMIPDYQVGETYGFKMRAVYVPFEDRGRLADLCRRHQAQLDGHDR